jgi:hypothetical protein
VAIGGAIWDYKQQPALLQDVAREAELQCQHATCAPVDGAGRHIDFTPERIAVLDASGGLVASRNARLANMRSTFSARTWPSNIVLFNRAIYKPTAWSSASVGASARSLSRPVLVPVPGSNRRCALLQNLQQQHPTANPQVSIRAVDT